MRGNTDLLFRMPADSCEWRADRICFILIVLVTGRYCSLFALVCIIRPNLFTPWAGALVIASGISLIQDFVIKIENIEK